MPFSAAPGGDQLVCAPLKKRRLQQSLGSGICEGAVEINLGAASFDHTPRQASGDCVAQRTRSKTISPEELPSTSSAAAARHHQIRPSASSTSFSSSHRNKRKASIGGSIAAVETTPHRGTAAARAGRSGNLLNYYRKTRKVSHTRSSQKSEKQSIPAEDTTANRNGSAGSGSSSKSGVIPKNRKSLRHSQQNLLDTEAAEVESAAAETGGEQQSEHGNLDVIDQLPTPEAGPNQSEASGIHNQSQLEADRQPVVQDEDDEEDDEEEEEEEEEEVGFYGIVNSAGSSYEEDTQIVAEEDEITTEEEVDDEDDDEIEEEDLSESEFAQQLIGELGGEFPWIIYSAD